MKFRLSVIVGALLMIVGVSVEAQASTLTGAVTDEHQLPIGGAFVTARSSDRKMAVTVLSDAKGRYRLRDMFPGGYQLEAHRIGYRPAEVEHFALSEADATKDFRLTTTAEIANQMPANAWLASLPEGDLKAGFMVGCTICHAFGNAATRKPRPAQDWLKVIKSMRAFGIYGNLVPELGGDEKLAEWLAGNGFGPDGKAHHFRPPAPIGGDAARTVITSYEVAGSNGMAHDMTVEAATGAAWVTDYLGEVLIRVDPRNGAQKSYTIPIKNAGPHTLLFDHSGNLWITFLMVDMVARFDPKTESFKTYPGFKKGSMVHSFAFDPFGYILFGAQGRIWMTEFGGRSVASLHPESGEVREYTVSHPSHPYGIAVDQRGRVWFTEYEENLLEMLDPETGVFSQHEMPRKNSGPHRIAIDAQDRLWIPESGTGKLAMYDIAKGNFTEYDLPDHDAAPYATRVDGATGAVWVTGPEADSLYRFDPVTKHFTIYRLPALVSYARMISIDYASGDVWTALSNWPYKHASHNYAELVRLHFPPP